MAARKRGADAPDLPPGWQFWLICMMSAKLRIGSAGNAVSSRSQNPDHHRQQIVEIVRDAAGELAHRLHLLGLRELDLEVLLLGRIDEMEDEAALARIGGVETVDEERQRSSRAPPLRRTSTGPR